jgi:hypothetical protein
LPHIQGGAVRRHLQQHQVYCPLLDRRSVATSRGRDKALFGVEDALGGVKVGAGDGVNRRPIDPPQRARFFDAVRCCGHGY